jgi:hypothetical protein
MVCSGRLKFRGQFEDLCVNTPDKLLFLAVLVANPHALRAIQGWLGHRSITSTAVTSTAVYTAPAPNPFKDFWQE